MPPHTSDLRSQILPRLPPVRPAQIAMTPPAERFYVVEGADHIHSSASRRTRAHSSSMYMPPVSAERAPSQWSRTSFVIPRNPLLSVKLESGLSPRHLQPGESRRSCLVIKYSKGCCTGYANRLDRSSFTALCTALQFLGQDCRLIRVSLEPLGLRMKHLLQKSRNRWQCV